MHISGLHEYMSMDHKYAARLGSRTRVHKAWSATIIPQPRLEDEESLDAHNIDNLSETSPSESVTCVVEAARCSQDLHNQLQSSRLGS